MFAKKQDRRKLGEKLIEAGKITQEQLVKLLVQQKHSRRYLGDLAIDSGYITDDELYDFLPKDVAQERLSTLTEREAFDSTESYLLQTALKFTFFADEPVRTLLVTSALPCEGKTVCANYLARTLASVQQGRFLLIDADLVNPTLHARHNLPPGLGWTDYIVNSCGFDECLLATDIDNLQFLPAGTIPPNPGAIFASRRMKEFIEELKSRFDLIVFDSSPVLPMTATPMLGAILDAAIVVVRAGSTKRQLVKRTVGLLNESRTKILGVVMNQVVDNEIPKYAYKYSGRTRKQDTPD